MKRPKRSIRPSFQQYQQAFSLLVLLERFVAQNGCHQGPGSERDPTLWIVHVSRASAGINNPFQHRIESSYCLLLLQWSDVHSSHGLLWYVCPRSSTYIAIRSVDTGLVPFQTHCMSSEICYQQPSHTATRGHSTFYFKKRCIMNFYYLIYRQSVPQIPRGRAMYSTRRHYCDTWPSH